MSSSTALLPKATKNDHPIFLRVCHSPWVVVNQKSLATIRGIIATYMTAVFFMLIYYENERTDHGWLSLFELQIVSYFSQLVYFNTTFVWTLMHLYYPHHGNSAPSRTSTCIKLFSPPRQQPAGHNRVIFSIYYFSTLAFPALVTLGYWAILIPHEHNGQSGYDNVFSQGRFEAFIILNVYVINSVIALIEIFVLSSIRRPEPVWVHIIGLAIMSLAYIAWAFIGKAFTNKFVYYFLDNNEIGWEYVLSAVIAFVGLVDAFFAVAYGLTGFREMLTKNSNDKSYGYSRLPE